MMVSFQFNVKNSIENKKIKFYNFNYKNKCYERHEFRDEDIFLEIGIN